MEEELYAFLDGLLGEYNLYPSVLPLDADYPCARYMLIYDNFEQTKDPYLSGLARFQLDIYVRNKDNGKSAFQVAHDLGQIVKNGINGQLENGVTLNQIREIRVSNIGKDYEEEIEAHIVRIEFNVYHK